MFTNKKGLIDFDNINLQMAYIKNFSSLKFCCGCCRSETDKKFTHIVEVGAERLEKDFDFKTILDYTKSLKDEVNKWENESFFEVLKLEGEEANISEINQTQEIQNLQELELANTYPQKRRSNP